jgi:hypothetical protein
MMHYVGGFNGKGDMMDKEDKYSNAKQGQHNREGIR